MMNENILLENLNYFEQSIIPQQILLHTKLGIIVIKSEKRHLKHLLGIQHSKNNMLKNKPGLDIFSKIKTEEITISDIVDLNQQDIDELEYKDKEILKKCIYFQQIFESLFTSTNLYLYKNTNPNSSINCDYLHFHLSDEQKGLYIGIIGNDDNPFFCFNSIIVDDDIVENLTNRNAIHSQSEKIDVYLEKRDRNDVIDKNIYESPRYITNESPTKPTENRINDLRRIQNKIQNEFTDNIKIYFDKSQRLYISINGELKLQRKKIPNEKRTYSKLIEYIKSLINNN